MSCKRHNTLFRRYALEIMAIVCVHFHVAYHVVHNLLVIEGIWKQICGPCCHENEM